MVPKLSATAFALFHSICIGGSNAAAFLIAYVATFQSKRVREFFEIWLKIILLDVLYLAIGLPVSLMAANINLIFSSPDETALSALSASGAGLLWSATILSVCILILLIKYVGRKL